MKTKLLILSSAVMFALSANAQINQVNEDECTTNCTSSNQYIGDSTSTTNNGDTHSTSSMLGNSSASNVSGNDVNYDNSALTTQNANNTTTGTISGGNTNSSATGGSSSGNQLSNQNSNSAQTGDSKSTVGDTSSSSNSGVSKSGNSSNANNTASHSNANSNQSQANTSKVDSNQSQGQGQSAATNSSTFVNTGGNTVNHKVDARTLVLPEMPITPPSVLAAGQMIKETTSCGPLQAVEKQPVTAKVRGGFMNWSWKDVDAGETMHLTNYLDEDGRMMYFYEVFVPGRNEVYLYGHQAIIVYALIGTSSATQTGIGAGWGSAMNWGNGMNGSTNSTQRLVSDIQLKLCYVGKATVDSGTMVIQKNRE